jgi:hypothetical protein
MDRRRALFLGLVYSGVGLLLTNGIGHAQQSDADKVKATIDAYMQR